MNAYVTIGLVEDEPELPGETFAVYRKDPLADRPERVARGSNIPLDVTPEWWAQTYAAGHGITYRPHERAMFARLSDRWTAWDGTRCADHNTQDCRVCGRDDSVVRDPRAAGKTFTIRQRDRRAAA